MSDKAMKIAIILSAVDKASRVVNSTVGKIKKGLNSFGNYATIGGVAATLFFSKAIQAAEESEIASARLSQVFKSMGQDYKAATAASAAYASGLQAQIGVEDETIMAVQAKLATFEKAANAASRANGIYNRATLASFDMAAAGFGDAENNIVQLGKALQDPITGINALRRSGITFTDAEKKKIAVLVKGNKIFEAQKMVMKAIEKQVGGVAAATVSKTQKMKIAWGEVMERIGNGLLPIFTQFANFILDKVIPAVQGFVDEHPGLVKWLAIAGVSLLVLGAAAKVAAFALSGLSGAFKILRFALLLVGKTLVFIGRLLLGNPVLLAIALIITGVYLIIKHWSKIKAFFIRLWEGIKRVFRVVWKVILDILLAPIRALMWMWKKISSFFSGLWNGIKNIASSIWEGIKHIITGPIDWIKEKWGELGTWFKNLWEKIKGWAKDIWDWAGRQLKISVVTEAIEKQKKIREQIEVMHKSQGFGGGLFPKSEGATNTSSAIPVPISRSSASSTLTYAPNITMPAGANSMDLKSMLKEHAGMIKGMIDEMNRKRDRTKFDN